MPPPEPGESIDEEDGKQETSKSTPPIGGSDEGPAIAALELGEVIYPG